jgi:hypothetical protein
VFFAGNFTRIETYKYLRVISYYCTVSWKVNLEEAVPSINDDEKLESMPNIINFIITYALTILVEILTTFLLLRFFHKSISLPIKKVLLSLLLVNVLSYPVS